MKKILTVIFAGMLSPAVFAAATNEIAVIPQPEKVEILPGVFQPTPQTRITYTGAKDEAQFFASKLNPATGWRLSVTPEPKRRDTNEIAFILHSDATNRFGTEGYELAVTGRGIAISSATPAGLFYGTQTLLQLLPPEIFSARPIKRVDWQIPCVRIEDHPRFVWRGLMLDVSRHFYDKAEVEKILNEMALHKLNVFHWHLTDDQGWRIEIKKYPKLTEIGAWRSNSIMTPPKISPEEMGRDNIHPAWATAAGSKFNSKKRYGGFYTQDDVREIVAYAAARHITIVPEIEMPGHAVAALAAYPQFGCGDTNCSTDVHAGVNNGVFDPGNPATFQFLQDVLAEVFQLFPGKYVHIGGDEVSAKVKAATWAKSPDCLALMQREGLTNVDQLQNWFTGQIAKFVSANGKTLIGWTEIADGGLPKDAVVMDWKGGGMEAAGEGHDVVMSPMKFCYLDHYQSTNHTLEPHAIGGYLPLDRVYQFEPIPAKLAPEFQSHILGGQCNLWTEYISSLPHAEYMIWPRECALAEVTWSPKDSHNYDDFIRRLKVHAKRLEEMGMNYRRADIKTETLLLP